jgi:hypothetical protein
MNNNNISFLTTPLATFSPLSGSEPEWNPAVWETNKKYNNCYAYAINNHREKDRVRKPEPGEHRSFYSCDQLSAGLFHDLPGIYATTFSSTCEPEHNKIFAAVSNEESNDFHFWRLDSDGYWSHKVGSRDPSRLDASGHPISNPDASDRHFNTHNYAQGCGFFCVPTSAQNLTLDGNKN